MRFIEAIVEARASIAAKPLRAILSASGFVFGVASLIATVSIGVGAEREIALRIQSLGASVLLVKPGEKDRSVAAKTKPAALTAADARAIASSIDEVALAAPALQGEGRFVRGSRNWSTRVNGTTSDYFAIRTWPIEAGRAFTAEEEAAARAVAVLGAATAKRLFGDEEAVGGYIRAGAVPIRVIGRLARKGQAGSGRDQDDIVFLPFRTVASRFGLRPSASAPEATSYILVSAAEGQTEVAGRQIETLLRLRLASVGRAGRAFEVTDPAAAIEARRGAARTISLLLAGVAAIALLAGGVGVANVMTMSVSERAREIGLRLAIGASRRDIRGLFLVEASMLAVAGSIFGIAFGMAGSWAIGALTGWPMHISPAVVVVAVVSALVVGMASGLFPALKASDLPPALGLRA